MVFGLSGTGVRLAAEKVFAFSGMRKWVPALAQSRLSASTRDLYTRTVRLHVVPKPFGELPIQAIRPKDVRDLFAKLESEGSPGGRGGLGLGSLHNVRTVLHKGLRQAQAEGIVTRNVVALVDPPPRTRADEEDEPEPEHWTAQQVGQFLDYVDRATLEGTVTERRKRKIKEYEYTRTVAAYPMLRALLY